MSRLEVSRERPFADRPRIATRLRRGNATAEVLADFRFVGGNSTVTSWLRENFGNQVRRAARVVVSFLGPCRS